MPMPLMQVCALQVEVPIASFRQSYAREYAESYPVPPPSTVYGMLLSLVGEVNRYRHCGSRLAVAMLSQPVESRVVRRFFRYKNADIQNPSNYKPDYQVLLTDVRFVVWISSSGNEQLPSLVDRLNAAFFNPASIDRFGGLCLGESHDLINSIDLLKDDLQEEELNWLLQDANGWLTLPYWVDHVGSRNTRCRRYKLEKQKAKCPPEQAWTLIQPD